MGDHGVGPETINDGLYLLRLDVFLCRGNVRDAVQQLLVAADEDLQFVRELADRLVQDLPARLLLDPADAPGYGNGHANEHQHQQKCDARLIIFMEYAPDFHNISLSARSGRVFHRDYTPSPGKSKHYPENMLENLLLSKNV